MNSLLFPLKNMPLKNIGIITLGIFICPGVFAQVWFNPSAIDNADGSISDTDLQHFNNGGQRPGRYNTAIYVNDNYVLREQVEFINSQDGSLIPLLNLDLISRLGINPGPIAQQEQASPPSERRQGVGAIPHASTTFDITLQRLDISIPQAYLSPRTQGAISRDLWQDGLPTMMVGYSASGARTWTKGAKSSDNRFLGLNSGINLGGWRLRNYSTYVANDRSTKWNSINSTLSHDVRAINGQLLLGDANTRGDLFDSVKMRGIQLVSQDAMLPDSQRGFAPVIRGIAATSAMVTVRQNNVIIYQTYVAPGAFEFHDLYPTGSNGDLYVTVEGVDGSKHEFIQPFSSVPNMLREGNFRYELNLGEYQSVSKSADSPNLMLGSLFYGVSNSLTLYGGGIVAEGYHSGALGAGIGLGQLGSLSFDVIAAKATTAEDQRRQGYAYRVQYAKTVTATDTTLTLSSYRYSTEGYYSLQEANERATINGNKKSRFQLVLSQSTGSVGNLYFSGYQQDYRQNGHKERNLNVGWNISHSGVNYNVGYALSKTSYGILDRQLTFSLQIPLDRWLSNTWTTATTTVKNHRRNQTQLGIGGTALADNNLSYSLQQSYDHQNRDNSGNASINYKNAYSEANAGYNYAADTRQFNAALRGGIVAHPYGVTLSQPLSDTLMLVRAADTAGIKVRNNVGVATDWRGYAVVPYASAYRNNSIALDMRSLPANAELDEPVKNIVPSYGALVLADFQVRKGYRALITLTHQGKAVPFGASVMTDGEPESTGIVADNGEVYLSGLPATGALHVSWGKHQSCAVNYRLDDALDATIQTPHFACQ
ncbi:fimbrial biogenesis outer membrane usher protein [Brenneria sp. 4F2]|nr:fimbrial biogenesis outer membrane usher protein [Brenneria bubanii]